MTHCADCSNAIVMSRDFEAWNEYGICETCLSKNDNPSCEICQIECKYALNEGPPLCGGDFCLSFPDQQVESNR